MGNPNQVFARDLKEGRIPTPTTTPDPYCVIDDGASTNGLVVGPVFVTTAGIPSAVAGYAKGCTLLDYTTGIWYENTGTSTSCTFTSNGANGSLTVQTGKTLTVVDDDAATVGGLKVLNKFNQSFQFTLATNAIDQWLWIAPRACKVTAIKWVHNVASTSGTLAVRKGTVGGTAAPGDAIGATLLALIASDATISTAGTANTNVTPTVATANAGADVTFAAGDRLGVKTGGTQTNLIGGVLTITFQLV